MTTAPASRRRALPPLPVRRQCPSSPAFCAQPAGRADVLAAWLRVGVDLADGSPMFAEALANDRDARNFLRGFLKSRDARIAAGDVRASDRREAHAVALTRAFLAFRAVAEVSP